MAPAARGQGYWLVRATAAFFLRLALFFGSTGGLVLAQRSSHHGVAR